MSELYVYRFRIQNQLYLLGKTRGEGLRLIYLDAIGPHENFYRDYKS
ncbi:MAG: type II toxin-antitoxin system RelE/ParE family toxin [Candidatus Nitrotoga sp.]|nr:type II toxin-antitoxin system RelE/ParE family toxin [Candidatus Nitrotoga sp.]